MSLAATLINPLRVKYDKNSMDKLEHRGSRYGAFNFFREQTKSATGVLSADAKAKLAVSMGTTVQIPVLNFKDVTITSTRTCTISPDENTSALLGVTFVTYQGGFTMQPSAFTNNTIGYEADWQKKMEALIQKFQLVFDQASVNKLETDKNTYWPTSITSQFPYPVVANALQVSQAQKNDFFNQYESIMNVEDFYGPINIVGSQRVRSYMARLAADGTMNAVNNQFQLDPYITNLSNRVVPGAGLESLMYMVPDDMVAVVNRNDPDSIAGHKIHDGDYWDTLNMPGLDMTFGHRYYKTCANISSGIQVSGLEHLTASLQEGFIFHTDLAFVTAYNSDTAARFGAINKVEVSAT